MRKYALILDRSTIDDHYRIYGARALVVIPECGRSTRTHYQITDSIVAFHGRVWNGSYHDAQFFGDSDTIKIAYYGRRKAGWIGKFLRAVKGYHQRLLLEDKVAGMMRSYRGREGD